MADDKISTSSSALQLSSIWFLTSSLWYIDRRTGVKRRPCSSSSFTLLQKKKKKKKEYHRSTYHIRKKRKKEVCKYLPEALWDFISLQTKKLKTVKEERTTTKRGAKNVRANEYLFKTSIKQYGGHTGRQISEGDSSQNIAKGLLGSSLSFCLWSMEKAFISYQREKNRQGKAETKDREREPTTRRRLASSRM